MSADGRYPSSHTRDLAGAYANPHVPPGQSRGRAAGNGIAYTWRIVQEKRRTYLWRDPAYSANCHFVARRTDQRRSLSCFCRCHVSRPPAYDGLLANHPGPHRTRTLSPITKIPSSQPSELPWSILPAWCGPQRPRRSIRCNITWEPRLSTKPSRHSWRLCETPARAQRLL